MARRRRQENPSSGSTIMWVALLGGAAYLAYEYLLAPNASAATVVAGAAPAATGTPVSNPAPTATAPPALGTPVTTAAQSALQVAANYPYIIIGAGPLVGSSPPSGYQLLNTADQGNIWARNDVVQAVNAFIAQLQVQQTAACVAFSATAPPGTPCPAPQVPSMTVSQIQQIMSTAGLHGLGLMGLYPLYGRMGWN